MHILCIIMHFYRIIGIYKIEMIILFHINICAKSFIGGCAISREIWHKLSRFWQQNPSMVVWVFVLIYRVL